MIGRTTRSICLGFFLALPSALAAQSNATPLEVVRGYAEAAKALDADRINSYLADPYIMTDSDGSERPYNRPFAGPINQWMRDLRTRWEYEVLSVRGDTVTLLWKEWSDYFTYLGLESGIQVSSYVVKAGKIHRHFSHLFVTGRSSQREALGRFMPWLLREMNPRDPLLVSDQGRLIFDGSSGPAMGSWMRRWAEAGRPD